MTGQVRLQALAGGDVRYGGFSREGRVYDSAAWLGIRLDAAANLAGGPRISAAASPVSVWVVPTNEELMIATHTLARTRQ